jgi:predicted glycosyltransferase
MRFLFDLNHPAHVHFFRHPIRTLLSRGHEVLVTSRMKEIALPLLDELGIQHVVLSAQKKSGAIALFIELITRDWALYKVAKAFRPDVMASIGGTFIAHVGFFTRIPSLVFYDTENAKLQNLITYPFAYRVIVPRCYQAWLPRNHQRYDGYHELSYLHPEEFEPSREIAIRSGLDPERDNFFIRTISWNANHDMLDRGWSEALLRMLIEYLTKFGKIHLSSESTLPEDLRTYCYAGKISEVHHLMAYCRMYVGESATMASECAVLGVPALYAATTGRGYTDEQETRYGLVSNTRMLDWPSVRSGIDAMMQVPREEWALRRARLLEDTIDVAAYVADVIEYEGRKRA